MIYNMKKLNTIATIFAASFFMFACGGGEESEETTAETNETEEVEVTEEESEVESTIAEDLDNATFSSYLSEKGGVLIDVRTADEFADGAIEGAINLDWTNGDFEAAIDTMDRATAVFVYCAAGGRSGSAKDHLVQNDFIEVYNLANGYSNWEE
jgi:rhodanese-related sulfurtransferase